MHILGLLIGLLTPAVAFAVTIRAAAHSECDVELLSPAERRAEEQWVRVDGVVVTGTAEHSTAEVRANLRITAADQWSWRGRDVVSLGEGMSGLVPFLHAQGLRVRGIDLWYDSVDDIPDNRDGRRMKEFVAQNRALLVAGDATALDLPEASVDVVLSHYLLNNLEMKPFVHAHEEILRIMRAGAEARLFAPNDDVREFYEDLAKEPIVEDFRFHRNFVRFRRR